MVGIVRAHPIAATLVGLGTTGLGIGVLVGRHNAHTRERVDNLDPAAESAKARQYLAKMDADLGIHRDANGGGLTREQGYAVLDYVSGPVHPKPDLVKWKDGGKITFARGDYAQPVVNIHEISKPERQQDVSVGKLAGNLALVTAAPVAKCLVPAAAIARSSQEMSKFFGVYGAGIAVLGAGLVAGTAATSELTYHGK